MPKKIIFLEGIKELSQRDLRKAFSAKNNFSSKYIFCLEFDKSPTDDEIKKICQALSGKQNTFKPNLVITPRWGTQSAWSSKAHDIFRNIGINSVVGVERFKAFNVQSANNQSLIEKLLDRMTESHFQSLEEAKEIFSPKKRKQSNNFPIHKNNELLSDLNESLGLALNDSEMKYLNSVYQKLGRAITDAELMMFSQINSEHCRHKIFRSRWKTDIPFSHDTLFDAIKSTTKETSTHVLSAYKDNSAVIKSHGSRQLEPSGENIYKNFEDKVHTTIKVETHNHPTGISPFEGAATGSGGEIRDCSATGRGARPKAGFVGLSLSHLRLSDNLESWETPLNKPKHMASPKDIILEAPIGSATYNNEFGRPSIFGYFRTLEYKDYGFHKPIMLAGGIGSIKESLIKKSNPKPGDLVIVLGGPSMLIGLGGGTASSIKGQSNSDLDFSSVQRSNPEMQRRAQQVLDKFNSRNTKTPISFIHDVGAGGICNAIPELAKDCNLGVKISLANIDCHDATMSPMEMWCNESQERYVFTISKKKLPALKHISDLERCPFSVAGHMTEERIIHVDFEGEEIVNLALDDLFGDIPLPELIASNSDRSLPKEELPHDNVLKHLHNVLQFPAVASKKFLITIGDRTVNGLVYRDQLIGNKQVPVSDYAATLDQLNAYSGQVFSIGEKPSIAISNPEASTRMAMAEAITNVCGVVHDSIDHLTFSANWMSSTKLPDERGDLMRGVESVVNLADELGISIPVGKDSLSMKVSWKDDSDKEITSPMTLNMSVFSNVKDLRQSVTPELSNKDSTLLHIWMNDSDFRMGGSCLYQTYGLYGGESPDIEKPGQLKRLFNSTQKLLRNNKILALHDISDGGLITTLLEMAFCSNYGLDINLNLSDKSKIIPKLFSEEIGLVVEVSNDSLKEVKDYYKEKELFCEEVAKKNSGTKIKLTNFSEDLFEIEVNRLFKSWDIVSHKVQCERDNKSCADEEQSNFMKFAEYITPKFEFETPKISNSFFGKKPKVALLREQGINGHYDMAEALMFTGFEVEDLHMSELGGRVKDLDSFSGLIIPGGFSYGDVMGAGHGMANSILFRPKIRKIFKKFFEDEKKFAFGICNGCQFLSNLVEIIPGAENWPSFEKNLSNQYECRLVQLKIEESKSILFQGMENSVLPVMVSHGEGRAAFIDEIASSVIAKYVDPKHQTAKSYPFNPNGSKDGIAGVCNNDGRISVMMPHPERTFLTKQYSWAPKEWGEESPWFKMFDNAYQFAKKS